MKVQDIIDALQPLPRNAEVFYLYDGAPYGKTALIWLARDGSVIVAGHNEMCSYDASRPADAPTKAEDPYWTTPGNGT